MDDSFQPEGSFRAPDPERNGFAFARVAGNRVRKLASFSVQLLKYGLLGLMRSDATICHFYRGQLICWSSNYKKELKATSVTHFEPLAPDN